jgi:hypothetical protein
MQLLLKLCEVALVIYVVGNGLTISFWGDRLLLGEILLKLAFSKLHKVSSVSREHIMVVF